jgi:hypothetical protein
VASLPIECRDSRIHVGARCSIGFQRTLRIPEDGRQYPLPPGLGPIEIHRVPDCADRALVPWRTREGFFITLYQREALWISFHGASCKPNAIKVGLGGIDAVSGRPWTESLHADPQDYIVCPDQLWLDGINAGSGFVRQFVAMTLGAGYTVEEQVSDKPAVGGLQFVVYDPKPGRFPDAPPPSDVSTVMQSPAAPDQMGLAAGGRMQQKIYPDPYGSDVWDPAACGSFTVQILNSEQFAAVTGRPAPLTPISAETYTARGFPWFHLYEEDRQDLAPAVPLQRVKSIDEMRDRNSGNS